MIGVARGTWHLIMTVGMKGTKMEPSVISRSNSYMDDQNANGAYWRQSVEGELASIQKDVLMLAILALPVLGLAWLAIAMPDDLVPLRAASRPAFALFIGALGAYYLRRCSRVAASWFVIVSMIVAVSNMIASHTSPMAITAGILIIVAANALLGPLASAVATVAAAMAITIARHLVFEGLPWWIGFDMLLLYALVWGAVYASSLQMRRAFEISAAGWANSRVLLHELRSRRGELHKLVTAQRESAYRLERMNRELVKARREAEHARHTKEQLVATISHELRGPLNLILGYSRILALSPESYDQPLPAVYRRDIDVIYRNSQQLSSLIDDVLDLSRAEADSLPLVKDQVHLAEDVITRVVETVKPLITRKGLELRLDIEPDLPPILGDAVRLRQILINLVSNAARLTDQGHIGIQARLDEQRLLVSVTDTGPGIAEEQIPRLFTPFTTLRPGDPAASGGAGLGLSISKRLVELHGGEMWAESVKGEGSTFAFALPLPGIRARPIGLTRLDGTPPRKGLRDTCLVIGEDPQLLRTLARYMQDLDVVGIPPSKRLTAAVRSLQPVGIVGSPQQIERLRRDMGDASEVPTTIALPLAFGLGERYGPTLAYLVKPITEEMLSIALKPLALRPDMRVLVVDDDPDAVRLLSRLLAEVVPQCEIVAAYSGKEALRKLDEAPPDLVLLDLLMPEVSGQEIMDRMAGDARLASVPVIVISARDEPDTDRALRGTILLDVPESTPLVRVAGWINDTLRRLSRPQTSSLEPPSTSAEARQA